MRYILACSMICLSAAALLAAPISPGAVHTIGPEDQEVDVRPGDIIIVRVPNAVLAKMVGELDVTTKGNLKVVGAGNDSDMQGTKIVPGSGHIKIFVSVTEEGDASLQYSYKNVEGNQQKKLVMVKVSKAKE